MPRLALFAVLALCAALAATAAPSKGDESQRLLRDNLRQLKSARALLETANSFASGTNFASASATAGGGKASTSQTATGPGAVVSGVSQVGQKIDSCQRGPANSAACETLTTADRSTACSDIPPDTQFTCPEQFNFGKCDAEFIFKNAFCLKSCNRCGGSCTDVPPSGLTCTADQCNSTSFTAGPYCLKTCGRCSAAA